MKRLLSLGVVSVVFLGGCATGGPSQGPLSSPHSPTAPAGQSVVVAQQLMPKPVIPQLLELGTMRASVVPLELKGSSLIPPSDPQVLGWWGTKVGSKQGATVLVGHTVHAAAWKTYGHGTLDNLEEVALGTDVNVSGVHYTVTRNNVISKAALARRAPHLFSQRGSHRLVLVTCEDYDPATGHYGSNVVLIAKKSAG